MNLTLPVYDDKGQNVVKSYEAAEYDLMFGTVMKLMELLKVEELDNQMEILKTVYDAWDEIKGVLVAVFPDVSDEDWKHVKVKELLPIIIGIAKYAVSEILVIPTDPKN
jgi:hypothetical protein